MKNKITYLAGALLSSAILMFSCSDDSVPTYREIAVDKTEVSMKMGMENPTTEINITGGNGNYKVTVTDEYVATATVNGTKVVFTGLKSGETTATVMDWARKSVVITVKIAEQ